MKGFHNLKLNLIDVQRAQVRPPATSQTPVKNGKTTTETTSADRTLQAHQRKIRKTLNFALHGSSRQKERYRSGSSNRLKISSWRGFKNGVWNVNDWSTVPFPLGFCHRKPLKSRAAFRETLGTDQVHAGQTHRIRRWTCPSGTREPESTSCVTFGILALKFDWRFFDFPLYDFSGDGFEGSSQCGFRGSGCENPMWWQVWELGGLLNGNRNVSVGLRPVGLELGIKFGVKHAAVQTL